MFVNLLLVGLGGAMGSMLRYATSLLVDALALHPAAATLAVNVVGSFAIGFIMSVAHGRQSLLWAVGLCGGFTTFAGFSNQTLALFTSGQTLWAMANVALNVCLCLAATAAGIAAARLLSGSR